MRFLASVPDLRELLVLAKNGVLRTFYLRKVGVWPYASEFFAKPICLDLSASVRYRLNKHFTLGYSSWLSSMGPERESMANITGISLYAFSWTLDCYATFRTENVSD
ncbi:MAG TPA: hypothetical protein VK957_23570 [Lunatimonas sp.]|nr:hypothetical protein [Lunatimonas sp.]